MIKLLALDIDGTILKKDYTISEKVKTSIKKAIEKGVKVLLVTGRMHCATEPIAKLMGIETPILSYQGSLIKFKDETIYENCIEHKLSLEIIDELRKFDIQINVYIEDELFSETNDKRVIEYCEKRDLSYKKIDSFKELKPFKTNKILAIGNTAQETTKALEHIKKTFNNELYVVKSMPIFCEIANKGVSKGNSIKNLAKKWDIPIENTMAIGDQDNDIEMLKAVGTKVAMGNATEGLKEVANYITESVDEDGAAQAIEKFILKGDTNV